MNASVRNFASFLAVAGLLLIVAPAESQAGKKGARRSIRSNLGGILSQAQSNQGSNQVQSNQGNNQVQSRQGNGILQTLQSNSQQQTSDNDGKKRSRLKNILNAAGTLVQNQGFAAQNQNGDGHENKKNNDGDGHGHDNKKRSLLFARHDFCKTKHRSCWWWYDYCHRLHHCHPKHYCNFDWYYLTCDYFHNSQLVCRDARWYLGIKGMILPGKGLGIESVMPGSPAALAGLYPGQVLLRCNGIDLIDEHALRAAVIHSNGILVFEVLGVAGTPPYPVTIAMQRMHTVSF